MRHKARPLLIWTLANALAWSVGWLAFWLIGSPLGTWIFGGLIWGVLAFALRQSNFSMAKWVIAGSLFGLFAGFKVTFLTGDNNVVRMISTSSIATALSLPVMALPLELMLGPLGIVLILNFLLVPRPNAVPRKQLIMKHAKSALTVAMVWCSVCVGGAIIGVGTGLSIRSIGVALGWLTMTGFNIGSHLFFGIIAGLVTGLAALRASRPNMTASQE